MVSMFFPNLSNKRTCHWLTEPQFKTLGFYFLLQYYFKDLIESQLIKMRLRKIVLSQISFGMKVKLSMNTVIQAGKSVSL